MNIFSYGAITRHPYITLFGDQYICEIATVWCTKHWLIFLNSFSVVFLLLWKVHCVQKTRQKLLFKLFKLLTLPLNQINFKKSETSFCYHFSETHLSPSTCCLWFVRHRVPKSNYHGFFIEREVNVRKNVLKTKNDLILMKKICSKTFL